MSNCYDNTPCSPCSDPCNQYQDCGCLNPTTWDCISKPPSGLDAIAVTTDMTGDAVLTAIDGAIEDIQDGAGKLKIDGTDTCPEYLADKIEAGLNVSIVKTGTGCDTRLVINSTTGGVAVDVNVKVSAGDTTTAYLNDKLEAGTYLTKSVTSPGGNEKVKFDANLASMISADVGNQLVLGGDSKLKTLYTAPNGSETKITQGTGVIVSGTGTTVDPYIISTNPSIQVARSCFDGIWRPLTLGVTGNTSVVFVSSDLKYRYRFDGSIELRGSATYNVAFGNYQSANRRFLVSMIALPTTCVTIAEFAGTADLKGITYIDAPQASADQITQTYSYIIRKNAQNLQLELQSSFTAATSKTIVVNFEGVVIHPNL